MSPINVPKPTDLSSSNVLRQWSSKFASPALAKPINLSTTLSSHKLGISPSPDFPLRPAPAHPFLLHQAAAISILPPTKPSATIPLSKNLQSTRYLARLTPPSLPPAPPATPNLSKSSAPMTLSLSLLHTEKKTANRLKTSNWIRVERNTGWG